MPPLAVGALRDYAQDWTDDVSANSTTLSATDWTVPTGITLDASSFTSAGVATARLQGDTAGTYTVTCEVTFANGEVDSRSMEIVVAAR
jgi:hypothetical protein